MLWCAVAGAAQLALAAAPGVLPRGLLLALAYPFMLPAVAVLHARAAEHRRSGAILASLAATGTVVTGLGAGSSADLRPAELVLIGMWWWTTGKMAAETGILPHRFGLGTAGAGTLALGAAAFAASGVPAAFDLSHFALGAWLLALAVVLARR